MNDRFFDLGNLAANNGFDDDDERACWRPTGGEARGAAWPRSR